MGPYRPRVERSIIFPAIRDRPVARLGDFHTVWGGINPVVIFMFVTGLSELHICADGL